MNLLFSYLVVSALTILIDFVWLGFVANKIILNLIRPYVLFDSAGGLVVREWSAILCWLLLVFGVYYFVIRQGFGHETISRLILNGMLFGFVVYGVYDLTTAAIQTLWPIQMVFLDIAWGTALCGICTFIWTLFLPR
ncbi:DUF2177 family protein [Candidatus Dependentiae bacterium]|nr:DUF2177 family protein [Candidatus Dependentiae bacterium]